MLTDYNEIIMHSGNMIDIDEFRMKTGLKSSDEVLGVMKLCLNGGKRVPGEKSMEIYYITSGRELEDPKELLTSVKVFLKTPTKDALRSALDTLKAVLYHLSLDSLIIWYPKAMKNEPSEELLDLWTVLDEYVKLGKIKRTGIADLDTDVFMSLYDKVEAKPEIYHLAVENCCTVPPDLQNFAEEKEIQLLTHYDPPDIIPDSTIETTEDLKELKDFKPYWIARYQTHIKFRGILVRKGYLMSLRQI